MKIDTKIYYIANVIFSILTIASVFFININVAIIFLGFSQLFSGLNQVELSQCTDLKEANNGNKYVGIFSIIVGLAIIVVYAIKLIF